MVKSIDFHYVIAVTIWNDDTSHHFTNIFDIIIILVPTIMEIVGTRGIIMIYDKFYV